ncbi:light harvesting complex protein [Tribonema minus]|uniref:Light harvesting complex protein n=1 Tax=Tribonema minus TaxID=303371 RepID=A0A836CGF9_9STRA|nr:light harvesting complex protein [Tribonema minus]
MVGSAAAFAPASFTGKALQARPTTSSALKMADASALIGKPFGAEGPVFDPLGLASKVSDIELKRYQECELKHGRVAMLAVLGSLVAEVFHPLFPMSFEIGPSIRHFQIIEREVPYFWILAMFGIGVFEADNIYRGWVKQDPIRDGIASLKDNYIVGDFGFDPLNLGPTSEPQKFELMRAKELNNGRLAMFAILGIWAQELVNGKGVFENILG